MVNTGYKAYELLERYYVDTGEPTGEIKPNHPNDPDNSFAIGDGVGITVYGAVPSGVSSDLYVITQDDNHCLQ